MLFLGIFFVTARAVDAAVVSSSLPPLSLSLTTSDGRTNTISGSAATLSFPTHPSTAVSFPNLNTSLSEDVELSCRGDITGYNLNPQSCKSAIGNFEYTLTKIYTWGPRGTGGTPARDFFPMSQRWISSE